MTRIERTALVRALEAIREAVQSRASFGASQSERERVVCSVDLAGTVLARSTG